MKKVVIFSTMLMLFYNADAQDPQADLRKGNDLYRQQQYPAAEAAYAEAEKKDPADLSSKFNKANAMHRQNKQSAAIRELDDLSFKTLDNNLKSKSQYNKGVILSGLGKTEDAVTAYKAALRLDPADMHARENLQKALKELEKKKQEPEPRKDQKQQQSKQQQQQQPQPQPQMNKKEAEQRLKLLEQKEKEVQQRLQKEKSKQGGGTGKDW